MDEVQENPFFEDVDLGVFRYTAAKYVRLLIRARWRSEPNFLTPTELARWELTDIAAEKKSAAQLVHEAADLLADINAKFIRRCGSGGVKSADETTAAGRLVDAVAFLVPVEGGAPHNASLLRAAQGLANQDAIDWTELVQWDSLRAIRDDLDLLPHPRHGSASPGTNVKSENVFRRKGTDWEIQFRDGEINRYQAMDGFLYVQSLVQRLRQGITPDQLRSVKHEFTTSSQIATVRNGTEVFDRQALQEIRKQLAELSSDIAVAKQNNDAATKDRLEAEKTTLNQHLASGTGLGGRSATFSRPQKDARDMVRKAILRAIGAIEKKDKGLASHLANAIQFGDVFRYKPEVDESWVTG